MRRLPAELRDAARAVLMLVVMLLLAIGAAFLTGCEGAEAGRAAGEVRVWADAERGVTCWTYGGHGGISCLPDYQLANYEVEPEPDYQYDLYHCSRTEEGCQP